MTQQKLYTVRLKDGSELGPIDIKEVKALLMQGEIHEDDRAALLQHIFSSLSESPELLEQLARGDTSPDDPRRNFNSLDILQGIPPTMVFVSSEEPQAEILGQLEEIPFPRLLYYFHSRRCSGRLHLVSEADEAELFFSRGKVEQVLLSSESSSPDLAVRLLERKLCTPEQIHEAAERCASFGGQLSDHLVALQVINPHELLQVLHIQFREQLVGCFTLWEGRFVFYAREQPKTATVPHTLELYPLILQGIEEYYDYNRLQWILETLYNSHVTITENPHLSLDELRLSPRQTRLLHMIDRSESLWELIEQAAADGVASELATHQFVFYLSQLEILLFNNHTLGARIQDKLNLLAVGEPQDGA